jgi:hypothetical protein
MIVSNIIFQIKEFPIYPLADFEEGTIVMDG